MKLNLSRVYSEGDLYITTQCELECTDHGILYNAQVLDDTDDNAKDRHRCDCELGPDRVSNRKVTLSFPLIEAVMEKFFKLTGGDRVEQVDTESTS